MDSPEIADRLDRHQASRDRSQPTVSVLSGPVGLAIGIVRRWAEGRGRSVVVVEQPSLDAMVEAFVAHLSSTRSPADLVVDWLASRLNRSADALRSRIGRMSPVERGLFLDASPTGAGPNVDAACRWILEQAAAGRPVNALGLGSAIGVGPGDSPAERAWVAVVGLIPVETAPVLLVAPRSDEPPTAWLDLAVGSVARLATLQPRVATALASCHEALETYFHLVPESRKKAMIRSGLIEALAPVEPKLSIPHPSREDDARSEAERYLFDRLDAMPSTSGLFELNVRIDIPFGPGRMMEGDLVCRALRVVIEVDGYYHLQDLDAYRRDRRKDFLLQTHGYLIIRVLASDVVPRLEEVLDLVLAAVNHRQNEAESWNRDVTL